MNNIIFKAFLASFLVFGALVSVAAADLMSAKTLSEGSMYSDQVARKKGDLITIVVQEKTSVSESKTTETSRESNTGFSGTFAKPKTSSTTLPALSVAASKDHKGEGTTTQSGNFEAVITGRVVDVLENGNLCIEARRQVVIQKDTKTIVLSGIIRAADVSSLNKVLSEKVHNFKVSIEGEGPLTRSQQKGILARILDVVWPF